MQDKDPKHCSRYAQKFYEGLESTGGMLHQNRQTNPIENLWHELKDYLRAMIKPTSKQELINGILTYWAKVDDKVLQVHWSLKESYPKSYWV